MRIVLALLVLCFANTAKAECMYHGVVTLVRDTKENYAAMEEVVDDLYKWSDEEWCPSLAAINRQVVVEIEVVTPSNFKVEVKYFGFLSDWKKDQPRTRSRRQVASVEQVLQFVTSTIPKEK